jgi:Ca-activated chloride channel family protein
MRQRHPLHPRSRWGELLLLLLVLPWSLEAAGGPEQEAEVRGQPQALFQDSVGVSWVLVPVVARREGGYADDLQAEDFRLFAGNKAVTIESFEPRSDAPLSLLILQDLSGSMANQGKIEASRRVLSFLLDRRGPDDEMALASFAGGRVSFDVPFTSHRETVEKASGDWRGYGTTTLHDAVAWLPEISAEGRHAKRAAILITDGVDNASALSPAAARLLVRQARLPVYVFGLSAADPRLRDEDGEKVYRNLHLLELLARASGGRFYSVADPAEIEEAAVAALGELRHQYVLGFRAQPPPPRRYRPLRVEVPGRKDLLLTFRRGYSGGAPLLP